MIYKMYWVDYDSIRDYLFEHDNKTQEQFEEDCIRAIREVGEDYLNEESSWISADRWIKIAAEKLLDYGYKKVDPIKWCHFGSDIIGDQNIDNDLNIVQHIYEEDEEWRKIVGNDLFEKAIEKNLTVYKSCYGDNIKKMKKEKILEDLQKMRLL